MFMPNSYTCLRFHIVFSTKNRLPLVDDAIRDRLHEYIGGIARERGARLEAAGGTPDHVHLLISIHPQTALSDLLREIKAGASRWIHETFPARRAFGWQDGYAAFSVSHSNVDEVKAYIARQAEHHRKRTFQEEFLEFLRRHDIPFDERYIWK
jgi:putative transposase